MDDVLLTIDGLSVPLSTRLWHKYLGSRDLILCAKGVAFLIIGATSSCMFGCATFKFGLVSQYKAPYVSEILCGL